MYNIEKKDLLVKEFIDGVTENLPYLESFSDLRESLQSGSIEGARLVVREANRVMVACLPEGIEVPALTLITLGNGLDAITSVSLTIKNKHKDSKTVNFKRHFNVGSTILEELVNFFTAVYVELITDAMVDANLKIVNEKLKELGESAGNTFTVRLVSPLGHNGKKLVTLTDDLVEYVVDEDRVFALEDLLIFAEESELVSSDAINLAFEGEKEYFTKAQTAPQFLGVASPLIGHLCNINKLVKPFTLIKKIHSKNVEKVKTSKETVAYYLNGRVYAVVLVKDGAKELLVKPFNVDTLDTVEEDVLANI